MNKIFNSKAGITTVLIVEIVFGAFMFFVFASIIIQLTVYSNGTIIENYIKDIYALAQNRTAWTYELRKVILLLCTNIIFYGATIAITVWHRHKVIKGLVGR